MVNLLRLVEKELSADHDSKYEVDLWHKIYRWYEEGGPENIESNLKLQLRTAESRVSENIKGLPEIRPIKKTKRKKRQ